MTDNKLDITSLIKDAFSVDFPAGHSAMTTFAPVSHMSYEDSFNEQGLIIEPLADGQLLIGYLSYDRSPEPWGETERTGEVLHFDSWEQLEFAVQDLINEGKMALYMQPYQQTGFEEHFMPLPVDEKTNLFSEINGGRLYVPPQDLQKQYGVTRETHGKDAAMNELRKSCKGLLQEYGDYYNGNVFGVIVEHWKRDEDSCARIETDSCWGHIGEDYAKESLVREMAEWQRHISPDHSDAAAPAAAP